MKKHVWYFWIFLKVPKQVRNKVKNSKKNLMFPLRFFFYNTQDTSLPLHAHSLLSHSSLHFFTLFSLSTLSLHLLTLLHFFPTFSHHFSHSTLSGHFFFPFLLHFLTLFCLSTFSLYFLYFFSYFLSFLPTFSFHFLTLLSLLTV